MQMRHTPEKKLKLKFSYNVKALMAISFQHLELEK